MNTMENSKITTDEPLVSIIIINFNGGDVIQKCISSIYQTVTNRFEIILIDNDSSDDSSLKCKKKWPETKLIENDKNIGLTARNIGIEESNGEFIVFLDSDTIVTNGWLENLIQSFKENGDGLYQPKLLEMNHPDVLNSAGNMINIFGMGFSRGKGKKDQGQYDQFQKISYTSGACTFTSSKIINKIGKINSIFFSYHDDLDYGWRGWLQKIPSYYVPKSEVLHLGSPTLKWSAKKFFYLERNRWICILYLYSTSTIIKILPFLLFLEIGVTFYFIFKGYGKEKLKSLISIFKLRKKIKENKKEITLLRQVSDTEVIENFVNDFEIPFVLTNSLMSEKISKFVIFLSKFTRKFI